MSLTGERPDPTLERLHGAQARLAEALPLIGTLDPSRERATPLPSLAVRLLVDESDLDFRFAFATGLADLVEAQLDSFPENIFWDQDLLAAEVLRAARVAPRPTEHVRLAFDRMIELQRLYGRRTPIRFRYVHDFSYGYDWAKWIARESSVQATPPGPFDLTFLDYMVQRGHELLALIEGGDTKYPRLDDDKPRNPFPFSREPAAELRLHRELAKRGHIPVPAWRTQATPDWNRPYADLRVTCAAELGT